MEKNSRIQQVYGVLGYPAKHSLSPAMHNAAFKALRINAVYKIFEKKPQGLKVFLRSLGAENIRGLNITLPYKERVMPFLDKISREAKLIRAVNTIKVRGKKLEGFNTDGEGFLRHLCRDLRFDPKGKIVAIIGAGGAARAVCVYLSRKIPRAVNIYDADRGKAAALVRHLKDNFKGTDFSIADSILGLDIRGSDLLINATPVGMKKNDPCLVAEYLICRGLVVYDLIYNPQETLLLKTAKERGAKTSNGLGMLLYQGARSFELWTGRKAPLEIMRRKLKEGL